MKLLQKPKIFGLLLLLVLAVSIASGYYLGNYTLYRQLGEMDASYQVLREEVSELLSRNEQLLERQAQEERHLQVVRQSMQYLQEMLRKREAELKEVRGDVDLYRKLMQSDVTQEIEIHSFRLKPGDVSGSWNYQLVLYQKQADKDVQGRYDVVFYGRREGTEVKHRLSELIDPQEMREFSFRYFEKLRGQFSLPPGLEVLRLEVEVNPTGKRIKPMQRLFEWRELVAEPVVSHSEMRVKFNLPQSG